METLIVLALVGILLVGVLVHVATKRAKRSRGIAPKDIYPHW